MEFKRDFWEDDDPRLSEAKRKIKKMIEKLKEENTYIMYKRNDPLYSLEAMERQRTRELVSSFHKAASEGDYDKVKYFLDSGIDVNVRKSGWTALHWAVIKSHVKIVKLLLENGADPNVKSYAETTPLILARFAKDGVEIAKLLRKYGAKE